MKPIVVFEDILDIVTSDYAGAENLRFPQIHGRFLQASAQLAEHFTFEDEQLYDLAQLYLQAIGDPKLVFNIQEHAGFRPTRRGFTARSDGKELYISAVSQEPQVRPGDRVATISYQPPAAFRALSLHLFDEPNPLTERDSWDALLNHARVIEVEREGASPERVILEKYAPLSPAPQLSCRGLDEASVYLKIQSFGEVEAVQRLLAEHHEALSTCRRLVLDLRQSGGSDREAVLPLLPYLCDRDLPARDFFQEGVTYTRYSDRNCDLVKANLATYLQAADEQVRAMAEQISAELDAKRGQGFLPEEAEEDDTMIRSCRSAEKIIVLTDTACEEEAEWLAWGCRRMPGVTLVGRPSRGFMETRNLVVVDYGFGRSFTYPISRVSLDRPEGGDSGSGVPVDVAIPWSREEIWDDLVLKQAIDL